MSTWEVVAGLLFVTCVIYIAWSKPWRGPKEGSQELVMAVWAAFGPSHDVERAEEIFRDVCEIVFPPTDFGEHEKWMAAFIQTLHDTDAAHKGNFQARMKRLTVPLSITAKGPAFRKAHLAFREKSLKQAMESHEQIKELFANHPDTAKLLDDTLEQSSQQIGSEKTKPD